MFVSPRLSLAQCGTLHRAVCVGVCVLFCFCYFGATAEFLTTAKLFPWDIFRWREMIEKWAMCPCTGMFAHVDRGVSEPVSRSRLLSRPSSHTGQGRAEGTSSQRRWKDGGWGDGWQDKSSLTKTKSSHLDPSTGLCRLLPIVNEERLRTAERMWGRQLCCTPPGGSRLLVWGGLSRRAP